MWLVVKDMVDSQRLCAQNSFLSRGDVAQRCASRTGHCMQSPKLLRFACTRDQWLHSGLLATHIAVSGRAPSLSPAGLRRCLRPGSIAVSGRPRPPHPMVLPLNELPDELLRNVLMLTLAYGLVRFKECARWARDAVEAVAECRVRRHRVQQVLYRVPGRSCCWLERLVKLWSSDSLWSSAYRGSNGLLLIGQTAHRYTSSPDDIARQEMGTLRHMLASADIESRRSGRCIFAPHRDDHPMVAMHALGTNGPETFAGESAWLAIKVHSRIIPGVTAALLEGMMEEELMMDAMPIALGVWEAMRVNGLPALHGELPVVAIRTILLEEDEQNYDVYAVPETCFELHRAGAVAGAPISVLARARLVYNGTVGIASVYAGPRIDSLCAFNQVAGCCKLGTAVMLALAGTDDDERVWPWLASTTSARLATLGRELAPRAAFLRAKIRSEEQEGAPPATACRCARVLLYEAIVSFLRARSSEVAIVRLQSGCALHHKPGPRFFGRLGFRINHGKNDVYKTLQFGIDDEDYHYGPGEPLDNEATMTAVRAMSSDNHDGDSDDEEEPDEVGANGGFNEFDPDNMGDDYTMDDVAWADASYHGDSSEGEDLEEVDDEDEDEEGDEDDEEGGQGEDEEGDEDG